MISRTNCTCMAELQCVFVCVASNRMCHWILCHRMCTNSVWYPNDISCVGWAAVVRRTLWNIAGTGICQIHHYQNHWQTFYRHQTGYDDFERYQQLMDFWNHDHHWRIPTALLVAIPTIEEKKDAIRLCVNWMKCNKLRRRSRRPSEQSKYKLDFDLTNRKCNEWQHWICLKIHSIMKFVHFLLVWQSLKKSYSNVKSTKWLKQHV